MSPDTIQNAVLAFPIFLFSLVFHEYAHALAGTRLGDDTARLMGRLTLHPGPHVDPLGTVIFPLVGLLTGGFVFGWARPVPFSPHRLRHPLRDAAIIAGAGPLSNVLLALCAVAALKPLQLASVFLPGPVGAALVAMGILTIQINVLLAWFNLLPLPPLDGSKVVAFFLPPSLRDTMWAAQSFGALPLLLLFMVPGISAVLLAPARLLTGLLVRAAIG